MTSSYLVYLAPVVILVFFGIYYFFYFRRIKQAGGMEAYGQQLQEQYLATHQRQLGLAPDEGIVGRWGGMIYIGELAPGSGPSGAQQVAGLLTGTSYRGLGVLCALTDRDRLAIAVERDDTDASDLTQGYIGMAEVFKPKVIYGADGRPQLLTAEEAFGDSRALPKKGEKPKGVPAELGKRDAPGVDFSGQVTYELVQLRTPKGKALNLWLEPAGIEAIRCWTTSTVNTTEPPGAQ